mgnify:CR=1 FL=1
MTRDAALGALAREVCDFDWGEAIEDLVRERRGQGEYDTPTQEHADRERLAGLLRAASEEENDA